MFNLEDHNMFDNQCSQNYDLISMTQCKLTVFHLFY